jgi:hypothetical protein
MAPSAKLRVTWPHGLSGAPSGSKGDSQEREHGVLLVQSDALQLGVQHPLEAERSLASNVLRLAFDLLERSDPIEAIAYECQPPLARQIGDVADAEDRVLQLRRDHYQVVGVKCDQLQLSHGNNHPGAREASQRRTCACF